MRTVIIGLDAFDPTLFEQMGFEHTGLDKPGGANK